MMIDPKAYFTLSYGLYVVTSGNRDAANGFIANSVFQVTAEPPQIAVSCNKNNYSSEFLEASGFFALSVLANDVAPEIITDFGYRSGRDVNKFAGKEIIYGQTGVPVVVQNCLSYFECRIIRKFDVGTHILFIGELLHSVMLDEHKQCMTYEYYRNVRKGEAPKNAPTYVDKSLFHIPETKTADKTSYKCNVCGYIYNVDEGDPANGIASGTSFSEIPESWKCPLCGTGKEDFEKI
jgi:flavin reductase (DIM6/NTAB) family NADH-FMN oxidoreductase RutF/rubredoxin